MQDSNIASTSNSQNGKAADSYPQIFALEIESWCHGLSQFKHELTPALVHRVIEELSPIFRSAIEHSYVFDLQDTVTKIHESIDGIVDLLELSMSILCCCPPPYSLDEENQFTLAQIMDQAEKSYGGVLESFERRWRKERRG